MAWFNASRHAMVAKEADACMLPLCLCVCATEKEEEEEERPKPLLLSRDRAARDASLLSIILTTTLDFARRNWCGSLLAWKLALLFLSAAASKSMLNAHILAHSSSGKAGITL
jgi:hypothetical protein